jgi:hypothetical protein
MALLAGLDELSEVGVFVTIHAQGFHRLIEDRRVFSLGDMALRAGDRSVLPRQRKPGVLMVNSRRLEARDVVAASAVDLELALMGILGVAIPAGGKGDFLQFAAPVALFAPETDVFPLERILRLVMLE